MEDDEATYEVPDASCSTQSSTITYCFLSGTNSYIDGTNDWRMMKKRLLFQLPHVPLKVLRGELEEEDIRDQHHYRFQAPGTSTEEAENDKDTDDDVTTDIGEFSEDGMARYLGSSIESIKNDPPENPNYPNNIENTPAHLPNAPQYPPNDQEHPPNTPEYPPGAPEYDTTGSINIEAADAHVAAHVLHLPDSDEMVYDDTAPLLGNMHGK